MKTMKCIFLLATLTIAGIGCGRSTQAIIPTDQLTAEQIEAVKAEDEAIADEELGGGMPPQMNKKKKK